MLEIGSKEDRCPRIMSGDEVMGRALTVSAKVGFFSRLDGEGLKCTYPVIFVIVSLGLGQCPKHTANCEGSNKLIPVSTI